MRPTHDVQLSIVEILFQFFFIVGVLSIILTRILQLMELIVVHSYPLCLNTILSSPFVHITCYYRYNKKQNTNNLNNGVNLVHPVGFDVLDTSILEKIFARILERFFACDPCIVKKMSGEQNI